MRQLLYISNSARDFAPAALEEILAVSRTNNAAAGITGMLLYLDGAFLQVLEGPVEAVGETYARIKRDRRHWEARTLLDQNAPRAFSEWSMGFKRLTGGALDAQQVFAITEDAVRAKLSAGAPVEVVVLLDAFQRIHGGETLSPV